MRRSHDARAVIAVLVVALVGCASDDDEPVQCLEALDLECAPAFEPTFDELFDRQLGATCGAADTGANCHGPDGRQGMGLDLSERDLAYDMLLGHEDGRARVIEGDPACSLVIQRLESDDPAFSMPPGAPLSEPVRCAFRLWVADGAKRDGE